MDYKDYKHIIPIQIRFNDVDRLNHVNNACYLSFFELGRIHYFNDVLKRTVNWDKTGFILARTEVDHLKPVFLQDEIYCCSSVTKLGNKSMTMKNAIVKKENGVLTECAAGVFILVAMDYEANASVPVPAEWRSFIEGFEN